MNVRRVLPFFLVALPLPAFASSARVAAPIADLRAEPSAEAKSKAKLPSGRDLEVIGKSDDGKWVRVRAECPKANETIHFEGWLAVRDVQGANLDGLVVAGSAKSSAAKSDWSDDKSASPASPDAAWGDDAATSAAAPAAVESKPASSEASWGSDDSKPAPAASSDSKGDEWGASAGSGAESSASKSGGDEWAASGSDSGSSDSSASSSPGDGW